MRLPSFVSAKPLQTIIRAALAGALLGSAVAAIAPARTTVSMSFTVAQHSRQATADYAYDGYYALRAAELVSDTMISWLSTPSVIKEIYLASGHEVSDEQALALAARAFRGKKFSSQNVVVTFSAPDTVVAADVAESASEVLTARAAGLALGADGGSLFNVVAGTPVIAADSTSPATAGTAGLFIGAFLGYALVYASRDRKNPQP